MNKAPSPDHLRNSTLIEQYLKHEAYVQKRKYLCSVMAAIEKKQQRTHTLTHA